MLPELNETELRIIGCLMEKSVVTPAQYPLTLNGLVTACNQKTSREPVMALEKGEVLHGIRTLEAKHLVRANEDFKRGTEKYLQRFCNTSYSEIQLEPDEFAVMTLLILRGPQTPGELKARSGRLHSFADNAEVVTTAEGLAAREHGALVVKLPRTPGRKDAAYAQLIGGEIDLASYAEQAESTREAPTARRSSLEKRVSALEEEVARLAALVER